MLASLVLALSCTFSAGSQSPGESYGFDGFEIYELADGVRMLRAGDVDGDGKADLAVINDARSRVDLLLRLDDEAADFVSPELDLEEPNALIFDGRFRKTSFFEERRVLALDLGDLDGDGRREVVYAVEGGWLRVRRPDDDAQSKGQRRFAELRDDFQLLRCVDLESDGRAEIVAAAGGKIYVVSLLDGAPAALSVLDHVSGPLDGLYCEDLNGDGAADLVTLHHATSHPLRVRLGLEGGGFGPRLELEMPPLVSSAVADLDGDGSAELLAVLKQSGRLDVYGLREAPEKRLTLVHEAFGAESRREDPTFDLGDLDGDGVADLVVALAKDAAITVFRGRRGSLVLERSTSPSLVGVAHPRIGDVDGDGRAELVVASVPERMLGVTRWPAEGEEAAFPRTLPVDGEPAALDLADVDGDGIEDAVLAVTRGEGRKREYELQVLPGGADGLAREPAIRQELEDVSKVPSALRATDLDGDGAVDVIVFLPGERERPLLLVQRDGGFHADRRGTDVPGLGVLEGLAPAGLGASRDGGVLVATGSLTRRFQVVLEGDELAPRIQEQINARSPEARFVACAEADLLPHAGTEIVLLDASSGELVVFARDAGELARIDAGRVGALGLSTADVDGDGKDDVVALGASGFAVLTRAAAAPVLAESGTWEPPRPGRRLDRIAVGDFDHDGRRDVALTETSKHGVCVLARTEDGLARVLGFRVFEERTFEAELEGREPRELVSADLDGDGLDDLALLVHDKLVVYLQE